MGFNLDENEDERVLIKKILQKKFMEFFLVLNEKKTR